LYFTRSVFNVKLQTADRETQVEKLLADVKVC